MKRVLILCFLAIGMMAGAQNQIVTKKLQLNNVPNGGSTDKILVRGADRVVKSVLRSSILPNNDFPVMMQGTGAPELNSAVTTFHSTYTGRSQFYLDNTSFKLYNFDNAANIWTQVSQGINDAPIDGNSYVRKDGSWEEQASSAPAYKKYVALVSQSGTGAPTATVLENTLGGTLVWTRDNTGQYRGTLAGAFPNFFKFVSFFYFPTWRGNIQISRADLDYFTVYTYNAANSAMVDGILSSEPMHIEIRAYN